MTRDARSDRGIKGIRQEKGIKKGKGLREIGAGWSEQQMSGTFAHTQSSFLFIDLRFNISNFFRCAFNTKTKKITSNACSDVLHVIAGVKACACACGVVVFVCVPCCVSVVSCVVHVGVVVVCIVSESEVSS